MLTGFSDRQLVHLTVVTILLIGVLDYLTGVEIRIFPLYFLPLVVAAWRFGNKGALRSSSFATLVWFAAQLFAGLEYSSPWIWVVNFITQGFAFVAGSWLVARLHIALEQEKELSRTDQLTGLANRRAFYEQSDGVLHLCKRNQKPVTLATMDLDNFKELNDSQGHQQGDQYLQQVGETLRTVLRESDIAARFGGDEFAILLPETDREAAEKAMEKVRIRLADVARELRCDVTASIGGVCFRRAPASIEQMTTQADKLMYQVKGTSKDRVRIEYIEKIIEGLSINVA